MRRALSFLFLLSFIVAACATQTPFPVSEPSVETPPTPYPDTPAPVAIDAPIVEAPALVTIRFINELDGWGVTETQVVRTNDGGVTWYNVTPPNVTETGYSVEVFTLDASHAWIQKPDFSNYPNSGFLNLTSDGGITWTTITVPFSGARLSFLNPKDGWALADLGAGAGSNAVAVYQTGDGGITWVQTYINDPNHPNASDSLPLGGLKSDLMPLDMQSAFISGVTYASGVIYLYRTDDGGHTWSPVDVPIPAGTENAQMGIEDGAMNMVSATEGFLSVRIAANNTQTAIYTTQDAGETWTLTPTLIPGGGRADFLSAQEAVIYNGAQFYVTKDAARTWSIIPPDVIFGETFMAMDFVNMLSGWVTTLDPTGHRSFLRTMDGGATWFAVIP